ncbi:YkoF-like protein [Chaetomium sp. MPI-CAGE-AT-0009]|nr:YkoF-like protein [Chaetomium sp. MPI-CAGE-AT-0009]
MTLRYLSRQPFVKLPHTFHSSQTSILEGISSQAVRYLSSSSTRHKMATDYSQLPTPAMCYVDFCLVPVGTGNVSVAKEVADVQKVLKASGLSYTLHSAGTTVEGNWDEVMKVIGQAHSVVHQAGAVRIQTSMRVGSRTDKAQSAEQKVKRVQDLLAKDGQSS